MFVGIYVDDNLFVGKKEEIDATVNELQNKGINLKVIDKLNDYLSCEICLSKDEQCAWIGQPHLLKNLEKHFGEYVENMQSYKTPGTPGNNIVRPKNENEKISKDMQKMYQSGVGMLLYLVKHTRPDIANPVRELSKSMDGANMAAYKELLRVIKFVLDTKQYGLKVKPKGNIDNWDMKMYCDSDYAGDKESRISITGFILYLMDVPISWKSKSQKNVTLSSSEAEYIALSEAAKEIKFVVQILISMKIPVSIPIIVRIDNVGAMFMTENATTQNRTRHVDIRYHFVREFVEEGFIKIIFVRSKENDADIFTKNVTGELYDKHMKKFIMEKKEVE